MLVKTRWTAAIGNAKNETDLKIVYCDERCKEVMKYHIQWWAQALVM
jgi:hypothetical protein